MPRVLHNLLITFILCALLNVFNAEDVTENTNPFEKSNLRKLECMPPGGYCNHNPICCPYAYCHAMFCQECPDGDICEQP